VVIHASTPELVVLAVLAFIWAGIGYRLSERTRKATGRTPWGLPSPIWALLWFLSVLLGLVLYLIAKYTDARRAVRMGVEQFSSHGQVLRPMPTASEAKPVRPGSQFPAYPRPANSPDPGAPDQSHLPLPPTSPASPPSPSPEPKQAAALEPPQGVGSQAPRQALPPPGWHPDPSGRFHYRWWDGSVWTTQVSVSGQHLIDTNPDQRIGQY
jgi:hypothetical protein